jgi:hypothetical protein
MKKLLVGILTLTSLTTMAQETIFKPFKVDVSFGYGIPGGKGAKGGIIFAVEPKYAIKDEIAVGLRFEGAVLARTSIGAFNSVNGTFEEGSSKVSAAGSYLLTGDYYFSNEKFRPFAGVGLGLYRVASAAVSLTTNGEDASSVSGGNKFGGLIRAGFEAGHFRLGLEYNLIPKTLGISTTDQGITYTTPSIKNGYFGIKFGAVIGGGRNDK